MKNQFLKVQKELTLEGKIVISVGLFGHADKEAEAWKNKKILDELHLRKIDLADTIYVIDVGGYIGKSTKLEIEYARSKNKEIRFYSQEQK